LCIIFQLIIILALTTLAIVSIPGDVYILPCAFAGACAGEMAPASGLETALVLPVHADHHDLVRVLGQILRPISMVYVPVENQHSIVIEIID